MDQTSPKPFVFVLMPFNPDFNDIYEVGIKPACRDAGAYCERVDEQIFVENILDRLYNQIAKADIIVAEMTGRNPNVFYEVGYAHALNKRVILLTKNTDDIPFDLKHYPHIVYEGRIAYLKSQLELRIDWCVKNPKEQESLTDFSLDLYLNRKRYQKTDEIKIEYIPKAKRYDGGKLHIALYNTNHRRFSSEVHIGLILTNFFEVSTNSISPPPIAVSDEELLYFIGKFNEILPNAWYLIDTDISISKKIYKDMAHMSFAECSEYINYMNHYYEESPVNTSTSYPMIIRLFTVSGIRDFPVSVTLLPLEKGSAND